jgi:hypothetical protein
LAKTTKDGKAWAQSPEGKAWLRDREDDPKAPLGVSPAGAWSDLQDALTKSSPKQDKIIRWVESGGNVNWTCAEGMTLLHYAAMQDNERMVRFLLDHRANVNAEAKFKMTPLLWACKSISTSVIPLLLDHGANPNARADDGHTALQFIRHSGLDAAENAAKLLISHGAIATPGKDSACPECGAPYSAEMAKRAVRITINREYAEFACLGCKKQAQADLEHIDKAKGVRVLCSCGVTTYIPPSVWCKTCGGGLSTGWQKQITTGSAADKAAREFTDPDVKKSRAIARELKASHGKLKAIHFKSHHPNFGMDFDFSDGKRISSGATSGDIIGMFAFGYSGGGPNRLQTFLDEMGFSISAEEIEKLQPGTTLEIDGASLPDAGSRRAESTRDAQVRRDDSWRFCVKCHKSDFWVQTSVQEKRWRAGVCPYCEGKLIDRLTYARTYGR